MSAFSFILPDELHAQMKQIQQHYGTPLSLFIRDAIEERLAKAPILYPRAFAANGIKTSADGNDGAARAQPTKLHESAAVAIIKDGALI